MIYTIGYAKLNRARLADIIEGLQITILVDCRTNPKAVTVKGFSRLALEAAYPRSEAATGTSYFYGGFHLGGGGSGVSSKGIDWLRQLDLGVIKWRPHVPLLLCKEEAPGDCHRHHRIAIPLLERHGIDCQHIYRDEIVTASQLQSALAGGRIYVSRPLIL